MYKAVTAAVTNKPLRWQGPDTVAHGTQVMLVGVSSPPRRDLGIWQLPYCASTVS